MSSKAGLRTITRLKASGKLREIKKTVVSDIKLLQTNPKGFVEREFVKLEDIAKSLHQEETFKELCRRYSNATISDEKNTE